MLGGKNVKGIFLRFELIETLLDVNNDLGNWLIVLVKIPFEGFGVCGLLTVSAIGFKLELDIVHKPRGNLIKSDG